MYFVFSFISFFFFGYPWDPPRDRIRIDFDQHVPGTGWESPGGVNEVERDHMWTLAERAILNIFLIDNQDLSLTFVVQRSLKPEILDSLRLEVNGTPLELVRTEAGDEGFRYTTTIPQSILAEATGQTELAFIVNEIISPKELGYGQDDRRLGVYFDWLEINPVP